MKILVALNNEDIKNRINEAFKEDVYIYDIDLKENVIEFLASNKEEYTVITKDTLSGNIDAKLYIKQMKLANPKVRIIYIVEKLTNEYKEFLFANEVFNIFEGDTININEVISSIIEDEKVVYLDNKLNEPAENYIIQNNVVPKEIIAVYGTSGSGKSIVSSIIAKNLSRQFNLKVALLDMDIQNPSIDIINSIDEKNSSLSQIVESIDNSYEINDIISKYMVKDSKNKNLWYITNNCSLFDCQNKLSNKYYEKIYGSIYNKSDYTIIDLPSSPFLDVVPYTLAIASKIIFVVNANYMSIRQAIKYIDLITKFWDNENGKIYIIINKMQKDSLEVKQIESLIGGYKIIGVFDYYKEIEGYINGGISELNINIDLDRFYKVLGLKKSKEKNNIIKIIDRVGKKNVNKSF